MSSTLKRCPQCGVEYPASARFCEGDGTALRSITAEFDLVGAILADRYHIIEKLGEGGMGQVYLAEHVRMRRMSALKVLHPGISRDIDAISRFNREAANASRISHPNVAAVYDFGETPDAIVYLAMEFVDGPPLTSVIRSEGALHPSRAADIVLQTAEALAIAHELGIVHRDLKPDNIMLAKSREGGDLVKVVDFGIAKAAGNAEQNVTQTGLVIGTPDYMSPEQVAGDVLDGRSDIYSLGLVAFAMLTGHLPFASNSAQESMFARLSVAPKSLDEVRPDVSWPARVQAVMDRALERDPLLRYARATDFGRDLVDAVESMFTREAVSPMPTERIIATPSARRPLDRKAALAIGLSVVSAFAAAGTSILWLRQNRIVARSEQPQSAQLQPTLEGKSAAPPTVDSQQPGRAESRREAIRDDSRPLGERGRRVDDNRPSAEIAPVVPRGGVPKSDSGTAAKPGISSGSVVHEVIQSDSSVRSAAVPPAAPPVNVVGSRAVDAETAPKNEESAATRMADGARQIQSFFDAVKARKFDRVKQHLAAENGGEIGDKLSADFFKWLQTANVTTLTADSSWSDATRNIVFRVTIGGRTPFGTGFKKTGDLVVVTSHADAEAPRTVRPTASFWR